MNPGAIAAENERTDPRPALPKLGELAVLNRLVDRPRIDQCLAIQAEMTDLGFPMKLGKILVEKHYLDRIAVTALLQAQARQRGVPGHEVDATIDIVEFSQDEHAAWIERVRDEGLVEALHIRECYDIEFRLHELGIDKQLGEVAVEREHISLDQVANLLEDGSTRDVERLGQPFVTSRHLAHEMVARRHRAHRFGQIAASLDLVDQDRIAEALQTQFQLREMGLRLRIGEILIELGHLTPPCQRRVLKVQKKKLGHIHWSELVRDEAPEATDRDLRRILVASGTLSPDQFDECRHVRKVVTEHGLDWSLGRVLWERGLVDRALIEELEHELRSPDAGHADWPYSKTLRQAYQGLLEETPLIVDAVETDRRRKDEGRFGDRFEREWTVGQIALHNGLVDEDLLAECFAIQEYMSIHGFPMKLGKILIEKHALDRIALTAILRAQGQHRLIPRSDVDVSVDIIRFTPEEHEAWVARVTEQELLPVERIDECFDISFQLERFGIDKKLGEVAVEKGYVDRDVIADILEGHVPGPAEAVPDDAAGEAEVGWLEEMAPFVDRRVLSTIHQRLFGRLVTDVGLASREVVHDALGLQAQLNALGIRKRIGEILVERGHLRTSDARRILSIQKERAGRVRWSDLLRGDPENEIDRGLHRILAGNGVLSADELGECRFVQQSLSAMGIDWRLGRVIWGKGLLEQDLVEAIEKEVAGRGRRAADDPDAAGSDLRFGDHEIHSEALQDAYDEILSRMPSTRHVRRDLAAATGARAGAFIHKDDAPRQRSVTILTVGLASIVLGIFAVLVGRAWSDYLEGVEAVEETRRRTEDRQQAHRVELDDLDQSLATVRRSAAENAVGHVLEALASEDFDEGTVRALLVRIERARSLLEEQPELVGDLEMALGRVHFYRIGTRRFRRLDAAARQEIFDLARAALERAIEAYGRPKARTRAVLHLPTWAPERDLYAADPIACYRPETATIDYGAEPATGRDEVARLLDALTRIEESRR